MKALTEPLRELAEFEDIYKKRKENPGMIRISGCVTYSENTFYVRTWRWLRLQSHRLFQ